MHLVSCVLAVLLFRAAADAAAAAGRSVVVMCTRALHTYIHTYMHYYYHSRIARLAPKVEGRSPSAMALFTSMPADCRAHGEGPRSQAPSSSRCYSNYHITVASSVRESMLALARLIYPVLSLPVRGLEHEDDDEAVAGSSDVGPGCVTSVPRHAR